MEEIKIKREISDEEVTINKIKNLLLGNILKAQSTSEICMLVDAYSKFVLTEKEVKVK